jgi:predicted kinase
MAARARQLLQRGETVVLDASWNLARHRDAARLLADGTHSDLVELRCTAAAATVATRLAGRRAGASDADAAIAAAMTADAEPWPEATVIDTDDLPELSRKRALAALGTHDTMEAHHGATTLG